MPTEHDRLAIEVAALRAEILSLKHAVQNPAPSLRHGWLKVLIHDLEYNPQTQYKIHLYAAMFWIVNAVLVTLAMLFFNDQWQEVAVFYVAIVSLYANFSTDYGAMSASLAAQGAGPLPEIPTEAHVESR